MILASLSVAVVFVLIGVHTGSVYLTLMGVLQILFFCRRPAVRAGTGPNHP